MQAIHTFIDQVGQAYSEVGRPALEGRFVAVLAHSG